MARSLHTKKKQDKIYTMKKYILAIFALLLLSNISIAQKWAYVETEYILANIPEYKSAQEELDRISIEWQKEIEAYYAEIDKLYKAYQAEEILLPEDVKQQRQDEIMKKEKEAKELQKQKFGVDGELFKKRQELVKPIQDKVYTAIKEMAERTNYAAIFDKSSDLTMLYTNERYNKSDDILEALGYEAGSK